MTEESSVLIDRKLLTAHVTILLEMVDEIERIATFNEDEMEDLVFFAAYASQAARTFRKCLTTAADHGRIGAVQECATERTGEP